VSKERFQISENLIEETTSREVVELSFKWLRQTEEVVDPTSADVRVVELGRRNSGRPYRGGVAGSWVETIEEPKTRGGQELGPPPIRMRGAAQHGDQDSQSCERLGLLFNRLCHVRGLWHIRNSFLPCPGKHRGTWHAKTKPFPHPGARTSDISTLGREGQGLSSCR
jgi:hypothetical protein